VKQHGNDIHGYARRGRKTDAYRVWESMIRRCHNPNQESYRHYGAKGVTVCDRWRDFRNFIADMGEKPPGMTIDRIDPRRGYEPGNVRWADCKTQARNKTTAHMVTFRGQTKCIAEWAEELGIKAKTLRARLVDHKMPIDVALTRPVRSGHKNVTTGL
jgi:pentatricopeptide repeat protein